MNEEKTANTEIKFRAFSTREKQSAGMIILFFIFIFISPVFVSKGFHDLFFPFEKSAHLVSFEYSLQPGNKKIERGDSLKISGSFSGSPTPVHLKIVSENGTEESLTSSDNQTINYVKANLQSGISYKLENEWFSSETYKITLIDRPFLQELVFTVKPPRYTEKNSFVHSILNGNQIQIPEGSLVSAVGKFSKSILNGTVSGLKKRVTFSDKNFAFEQTFFTSSSLRFFATDSDSLSNRDTTSVSISVVRDLEPSLQVLQPEQNDEFIKRDFKIPVHFLALDDYGIANVMIRFRVLSQFDLMEPSWKEISVLQPDRLIPNLNASFLWEIPQKNIVQGDVVEIQIGVADAYPFIKGGHVSWSSVIKLKTPTLDELFKESEKVTDKMKDELNQISEQSKKLSEKIEKTSDDLKKKNSNLTFAEKEQIKQLNTESKNIQKQFDDAQKQLNESLKKLNENQTLPPETLEKYLELQKLLADTKNDKLQEMMDRLQNQINNVERKDLQKALDDLKMNNDDLAKQIDKTIKTIKRLQNEQKIEEMNQRASEMATTQQEIQKESQSKNPDFSKLESMQNQQTEKLKDFEKTLDQVQKNASENDDRKFIQSKIDDMKNFLQKEKLVQQSQQMEQSAQKKNSNETQEKSKELSKKLQDVKKQSDQLQQEMKENQNMITLKLLRQLMLRSNKLSDLMSEPAINKKDALKWGANYTESMLQSLKIISDSASFISERDPQVGMLLNKDLSTSVGLLSKAKDLYVDNQLSEAETNRNNSRIQINTMIYRILMLMNQQQNKSGQQSGQGEQQKSFMDEMRELANRQQELNQQVLDQQGQQNQESGPGKERLAQMAAQQQAIKQQLQQLMEKAKQKGENLGLSSDMTPVQEEMDKAAKELSNQIDSKLIERQQKILSRMLESQRSTIQREFEEKRESFANKQLFKGSDKEIQFDPSTLLQLYQLNSQLSSYPESYQKFIRDYLQELQKKSQN